jgi:hypothetical protein
MSVAVFEVDVEAFRKLIRQEIKQAGLERGNQGMIAKRNPEARGSVLIGRGPPPSPHGGDVMVVNWAPPNIVDRSSSEASVGLFCLFYKSLRSGSRPHLEDLFSKSRVDFL